MLGVGPEIDRDLPVVLANVLETVELEGADGHRLESDRPTRASIAGLSITVSERETTR